MYCEKKEGEFKCLARESQGRLQKCLTWALRMARKKCARQRGPGMYCR